MANSAGDVIASLSAVRPFGAAGAATPDNRATFQVWDFAPASTEFAFLGGRMRGWDDSSDFLVRFIWTASTAVAGDGTQTRWEIAFWLLDDDGDDIDAGWNGAASQGVSVTPPAVCGDPCYTEIPFTAAQINGITNGKAFRIMVHRDHDHADDDMAGDAELWADSFEIIADP